MDDTGYPYEVTVDGVTYRRTERTCGSGGQGVVFCGRAIGSPEDAENFALKFVKDTATVRRQVEILKRIDGRVGKRWRYHGCSLPEHGLICIVTGYLPWHTLQQSMELGAFRGSSKHQSRTQLRLALQVIIQLLNRLEEIHALHIVHRDVKPSNIMVDLVDPQSLELIDFDDAMFTVTGADRKKTEPLDKALAQPAVVLYEKRGTQGYLSPWHFDASIPPPRADLWSAGAILYEMLTGACPFPGRYTSAEELLRNAYVDIPVTSVEGARNVLHALNGLLRKVFTQDAGGVGQAAVMRLELERMLESLGATQDESRRGGTSPARSSLLRASAAPGFRRLPPSTSLKAKRPKTTGTASWVRLGGTVVLAVAVLLIASGFLIKDPSGVGRPQNFEALILLVLGFVSGILGIGMMLM